MGFPDIPTPVRQMVLPFMVCIMPYPMSVMASMQIQCLQQVLEYMDLHKVLQEIPGGSMEKPVQLRDMLSMVIRLIQTDSLVILQEVKYI